MEDDNAREMHHGEHGEKIALDLISSLSRPT